MAKDNLSEIVLIESRSVRQTQMSGMSDDQAIEILTKVKALVFLVLHGTDQVLTTNQVASFYGVSEEVARDNLRRFRDELESDGVKVLKGKDLRAVREILSLTHNTPHAAIWTPRSVLRLGMVLEKSLVAKQVRSKLLDSVEQFKPVHEVLGIGEVAPPTPALICEMYDLTLKGVVPDHLIAGAKMESLRKEFPQLAVHIDEAKKLLPLPVDSEYVTVTELAKRYHAKTGKHLSKNGTDRGEAIEMNKLLLSLGLQFITGNKEPKYLPSDKGKSFCDVHLQTAKGSNRTCQGLRWKPAVIDLIVG